MAETIKGLTISIGADTKTFNKEIKQVDKDIRETQKQADNLTKSLQVEFDSGRFSQAQKLAQEAIEKTEKKAQALKDQLKYLEETGGDKTSDNYKKLETQLTQTEAQAILLKKKLNEINELKLDSLAKQFETVGQGISNVGSALLPLSTAATGVIAGLAGMGISAVNAADNIGTLATQIGMTAEELQKWQYIAMQTDVTDQQLQTGLTKVQATLADMASGTVNNATSVLEQLGISSADAAKGMNANFDSIVSKLSELDDPLLQASYANELFGDKLGSKLIPLLQSGGDGISALADEFESLGYMTNEQVSKLSEFDNVLNKLKYQFSNIKNEIGIALLPIMENLANLVQEKIIPAFQKFSNWISSLSQEQLNLALKIALVVAALGPALLIVGKITSSVGGLVRSLGSLQTAFTSLAANPIIAVIGLIAALLTILYMKNEQFRESINNLVSILASSLQPALNLFMSVLEPIMSIVSLLADILGSILTPVIEILVSVLTPVLELFSLLLNLLTPLINLALIPLQLTFAALEVPLQILASLLKLITPLFSAMGNVVKSVFQGIISWINKALGLVESAINWLIDKVNKVISGLNKIPGVNINKLDTVELKIGGSVSSDPYEEILEDTSIQDAVTNAPTTSSSGIVNNDYSNKDITINITVQNYGEELDYDSIAEQINLKLAEQM